MPRARARAPSVRGRTPRIPTSGSSRARAGPARARSAEARISATAPSVICELFPAVTVPNFRSKTGLSFASASGVWFSRIPLSRSATSAYFGGTGTGITSPVIRPSVHAAAASLWLRSAKASCSSRPIANSRARTSAVSPMFSPDTGSVSPSSSATTGLKWRGRSRASAASRAARLRDRATAVQRSCASSVNRNGMRDIDSTAPATTRSASPERIRCAASTTLSIPEAQLRLTVNAGTFLGILASRAITRATFAASAGPAMFPTTTSSIDSGSISARSTASRMTTRPSSTAPTPRSTVPALTNGVRAPVTTTTSRSPSMRTPSASRPSPDGCRTSRASCTDSSGACRWPWPSRRRSSRAP